MQIGNKIEIPEGFQQKSHSFTIPIHHIGDFLEYGKIISLQTTGDFHLYISFDSKVPPFYSHSYHYYHQSDPISSQSNLNTQRLTYNPSYKVVEVYSSGPQLDIIIPAVQNNAFDHCFNKFSHTALYICIHACDQQYDPETNEPFPTVPISLVPISAPRDLTKNEYDKQYLPQCIFGNVINKMNGLWQLEQAKLNKTVDVQVGNLLELYDDMSSEEEEDCSMIDSQTNTIVNTSTKPPTDINFDDDFASDDDDASATPITTKPLNSSKTTSVQPGMKLCSICSTLCPSLSFDIHTRHCSEQNQFCGTCNQFFRKNQHIHCDVCEVVSTSHFIESHKKQYHDPIMCECLPVQFRLHSKELGLSAQDFNRGEFFFPYPSLHSHRLNDCVCREITCSYCSTSLQEYKIQDHELLCGNREYQCVYCGKTLSIREKNQHFMGFHHFSSLSSLPDPVVWQQEHLHADTSAEVQSYRPPAVNESFLRPFRRINASANAATSPLESLSEDDRIVLILHCQELGIDPYESRNAGIVADISSQLF